MKLLITGAIHWDEKQKKDLTRLGHEIIYIQDERIPLKEQEIEAKDIEGTICNGLFLYNDISEFKNLKYIQLVSAGFDRVPMGYIKQHHIRIYNAKNVYSIPMAEFAICGVLQLYKQSCFFRENQKKQFWEKHRYIRELAQKSVCIIGCGSIGTECAKRFRAFECKITGVDIDPRQDSNYEQIVKLDYLENILPESDIVILSLPLTDKTKYLMNAHKLSLMKQGAVLVNIARGAVLDTRALINILPNLGGAVLDVFEEEPLASDNLLWKMKNVIITPHNSFVGDGNAERINELIFRNLREIE